jgi:hypothetical protein
MACDHCTRARAGVWHGQYDAACEGCCARSLARSLAGFNALHAHGSGDKMALQDLIVRNLPKLPYADARRSVWEWWLSDRSQLAPPAANDRISTLRAPP